MASAVRMLVAGMALFGNTVALITFALGGGAVFTRITTWYSSITYATPPVIDPAQIGWIFPVFYSMLLALEIVLIYVTFQTIWSRKVYYTDRGY